MESKKGRPRRYDITALTGFACSETSLLAAMMDELRERVYDQVIDLPQDALDFVSGQTKLSIGRLLIHLAWAENNWITRLSGLSTPSVLEKHFVHGKLEAFSQDPPSLGPVQDLIALCRQVRDEITIPYLSTVEQSTQAPLGEGTTICGVLAQLSWHWIYHSGHIGLLRLEWGSDYEWTMHMPMSL